MIRWLITGFVVLAMSMALGSGVARAHPTLLFTEPATETAVASSPPLITLLFNEPVTIGERAIVLLDEAGRQVPTGPVAVAREGRFVTARPSQQLEPGTYAVLWRVTGSDGDQVEQEFRFAVGLSLAAATDASVQERPAWSEAALRWMLFAGLAVAIGGLIAQRFTATARAERPELPPVRTWAPPGLLVALAGVLGLMALRVLDAGTLAALWDGQAGLVLMAEAAGLLAALVMVKLRRWALAPLAVVVVAEGIRSHLGTTDGAWGAVLTGVHLAAITVWVGALVHSVRAIVAWQQVAGAVRWVLASYVRLALWTYLVVVASGVVSVLALVPVSQLFSTTYGRVLLIKLALVAAASAAALGARTIHRDRDRHRSTRLRRLMAVESGLLAVVLMATAVLVSTPPPAGSADAAPPPPPAVGPVLPLGALAGQIGVSVTASDGLLVVRLSTPRRGDYYAPESNQQYSLAASLGDTVLALTGCGSGCYYAHPTWRDGDNVLTLRADATGWAGGDTGLIVSWPPLPGADELAAAVAETRASGAMIVYEAVASDTRTASPEPSRLDLDPAFFLSQEPYADGTAPIAVRISADGAPVRLALGYPAASINVQLTLDGHGRIVAETLTDAKHLVTRRIVYPGSA